MPIYAHVYRLLIGEFNKEKLTKTIELLTKEDRAPIKFRCRTIYRNNNPLTQIDLYLTEDELLIIKLSMNIVEVEDISDYVVSYFKLPSSILVEE